MKTKTAIPANRRDFLRKLGAGSLAAISIPAFASDIQSAPIIVSPGALPDEKYWEQVKKQFAVPANLIMLNAANLCPSPVAVSDEDWWRNRDQSAV